MSESLARSVPGPVAPDDQRAWYAPSVRSHYHVSEGIVATVTDAETAYAYRTREPVLSEREQAAVERAEGRFDDSRLSRPKTRAGAVERIKAGVSEPVAAHLPELDGRSPASRRRVQYHLLASLRSLGALTPLALDQRVEIADTTDDTVIVHTREFAPASTELSADVPALDRFLGERRSRTTVPFAGIDVPVTVVRSHVLGEDTFEGQYLVDEPDLFPGDRGIIDTVKQRILESPPEAVLEDELDAVLERARTLLTRRVGAGPVDRLTRLLPWTDRGRPFDFTPERSTRSERIDALAYYVARDLVGDGPLTIPMRDPAIRSIEADGIGERIAVVPHRSHPVGPKRLPASMTIDDRPTLVDLTRSLAADGGVELSVENPTATISLTRVAADEPRDLDCSVALPSGEEQGHASITAERGDPSTPIALIRQGILSPALVAAVWTVTANRGTVVFVGPVDAEPEHVLEAHLPFIPPSQRPVAIGPNAEAIDLPHESGLSAPSGDADVEPWTSARKRQALHPDVAVVPGVTGEADLARLGEIIAKGQSTFAAARSASRRLFGHLLQEAGVTRQFGTTVDLVVELDVPTTDREATGWIPSLDTPGVPERDRPAALTWDPVSQEDPEADLPTLSPAFRDELSRDESDTSLEQAFARRYRYVEYLLSEDSTDREALLRFLADLRTDEPATIERLQRR